MLGTLTLLIACQSAPIRHPIALPTPGIGAVQSEETTSTGVPQDRVQSLDLPEIETMPDPIASVDVLVIGAGAAGLSAAWEAREAGATVLVIEASDTAGGNGRYAGNLFAVDTALQAAAGIDDSVELALSEWAAITDGGDPSDPTVQAFVEGSADTLAWLEDTFDIAADNLGSDYTVGSVLRIHAVGVSGTDVPPTDPLVAALSAQIWLEAPAGSFVLDEGEVTGVTLANVPDAWVRGRAVVVATGGFARNVSRLLEDRPELDETGYVAEMGPTATGGGHALLEALGADFHNAGRFGVYVHALVDYRPGYEGEALWPKNLASTVIVDSTGTRVDNEQNTQGFRVYDRLLDTPDRRLFAIWPGSLFASANLLVPAYNWSTAGVSESLAMSSAVAAGYATVYTDAAALADGAGFDEATITATIARYEELVVAGEDADHGKMASYLVGFGDDPIGYTELVPGAAKSFGGVRTDELGRVLYADGSAVPGLYAVGEVAGMLGTDAIGGGLSGSVGACYYMGRVGGQQAARYAHYETY